MQSWEFWCLNWLTCYRTHVPASMSNPGPLPSCLNKLRSADTDWILQNLIFSPFFAVIAKQDPKMIKCYHESSGGKFQHCMKEDGFETCFSKFDHSKSFHSKTIDCNKKKLYKAPFARKSNCKLRSPADFARVLFQEENVPHRVRESYEWYKVRKSKMLKK